MVSLPGVLDNDYDPDSDPLTAELVDDVAHGSLTLNSDGSFSYSPDFEYEGMDSFTYQAYDGTSYSNTATVWLEVLPSGPFGYQENPSSPGLETFEFAGPVLTSGVSGNVIVPVPVAPMASLTWNAAATEANAIVAVEVQYIAQSIPSEIEVQVTLDSLSTVTVHYDGSLNTYDDLRFAVPIDASSLATGRYDYDVTITAQIGLQEITSEYSGSINHINLQDSTIGAGWVVDSTERLVVGTDGLLLVRGDGSSTWFVDNFDFTYSAQGGGDRFSTLEQNFDYTYTLTDKYGNVKEYDEDGLLTSRIDTNGNEVTYSYIDADSDYETDDLYQITDPYGRTTTFAYSSGLLATVTDHAGRVTTVTHDGSDNLTNLTYEDPDDTGPLDAPEVDFGYATSTNRLISITDPLGNETDLTYDFASRLVSMEFEDSNTREFTNLATQGLIDVDGGEGTTSNPASYQDFALSFAFTDELDRDTTATVSADRKDWTLTDALGNTFDQISDEETLAIVELIGADPDGLGSQTAPETFFEYDTNGNLTTLTQPDNTTVVWTYHSTLNLPLTITDELGNVTTFTYDSYGNLLTVTDELGNVTEYEYNSNGLVTSITGPDPDGMGSMVAPETTFAYDSMGRLTTITNPDTTTRTFTYDSADNLLTETDELGRVITFTYDALGRMTSMTLPDPDDTGPLSAPVYSYEYDAAGNLTSETDPDGNETTYVYNSRGWVTSVTLPDPDGAGSLTAPVISFTYDAAGNILTETDPLGNVTTYEYDDLNQLVEITESDPDGAGSQTSPVTTYAYDNLGRLILTTDALGNETASDYDIMGRLVETTDELAGTVTSTYDDAGNLLTVTDQLGRVTTYTYDDVYRMTSMTLPDPDDSGLLSAPVYSFTYYDDGRLATTTDPLSNTTTNTYDIMGRLVSVTAPDPDGAGSQTSPVWEYAYDNAGQLTSITDPLDRVTEFAYDDLGRQISITDALDNVTEYEYNVLSRLTLETDALSNETAYEYDNLGRLITITDALDGEQSFAYDAASRLTSVTDELDHTTSYTYDNLGRTVSITDALSNTTDFTYDAVGNVLTITDALDNVTTYAYDGLYRRTSITDALSGVTEFAFDAVGNLTSLTDASDNVTSYTYDDLNRLLTETNELTDTRTYTYDAAGNVTTVTERTGLVKEYTYDNLYRKTVEVWKDGTTTVETIDFAYDAAGRMTGISDSNSEYAYTYDDLDRVTEVDNTGTTTSPVVILTSTYDDLGRRTALAAEVDSTDDFLNSYTYDDLSRLTRVEQTGQTGGNSVAEKRVDFTYDDAGRFATISRYEDLAATDLVATTTYAFDNAGRLTSLDHDKGTTSLASYDWTFDDAGRITQFVSVDGTSDYTYDDLGQLTAADHDYQADESYSYDATGNRTNTGYSTGDNNQLLSDGTYNYEYDEEGNRTKKTNATIGDYVEYSWDHRNRLVTVTFRDQYDAKTKEVLYTYDVYDRLIYREVDDDGDSTIDRAESFIYDGDNVVLVFDESSNLTNRFLYGPAVDQVLADEDAVGEVLWGLTDNLGTVRDLVDYDAGTDTTTVENHREFDAFGNLTAESNSSVDFRYSWTGRFFDEDAELQYNRARWYDGTIGRWIGEDPLSFAAGDVNLSRYVGNGPTNFIDPTGLEEDEPGGEMSVPALTADSSYVPPPPMTDEQYRREREHVARVLARTRQEIYEENAEIARYNAVQHQRYRQQSENLHSWFGDGGAIDRGIWYFGGRQGERNAVDIGMEVTNGFSQGYLDTFSGGYYSELQNGYWVEQFGNTAPTNEVAHATGAFVANKTIAVVAPGAAPLANAIPVIGHIAAGPPKPLPGQAVNVNPPPNDYIDINAGYIIGGGVQIDTNKGGGPFNALQGVHPYLGFQTPGASVTYAPWQSVSPGAAAGISGFTPTAPYFGGQVGAGGLKPGGGLGGFSEFGFGTPGLGGGVWWVF